MRRTTMGKIKVYSLGIAGILAIGSYLSANPPAAGPAQKNFDAQCSSCHGKDGKGKAAMAKVFKVEPAALDLADEETLKKSEGDLVKIILGGKNKMPAFKGKMSDKDAADILTYARSLKKESK